MYINEKSFRKVTDTHTFDPTLHVPSTDSKIIPPNVSQEEDDSLEHFDYSEKSRHQGIIEKLMRSQNGKITLEDVAQKPLKKLTISRAFMDVLSTRKNVLKLVYCSFV